MMRQPREPVYITTRKALEELPALYRELAEVAIKAGLLVVKDRVEQ